jgi:3-hydroxyacyl-CoA dehydrogenase
VSTIAIVGAGPQLGFAIGAKFAEKGGFNVALVARREAQLEAMADRLRSAGVSAAAFADDVTDRPSLEKALAGAEEYFGSVDVLEYSPAPTLSDLADRPLVSAADLTVEAIPASPRSLIGDWSPRNARPTPTACARPSITTRTETRSGSAAPHSDRSQPA